MRSPADAIIAVTHRCNAHCAMCNVWKGRAADVLLPEHMARLPASLRTVNLSGGEPFLRDDLDRFVHEVRTACPRAAITISTNAYLPDRIAAMMDRIVAIDPRVRLAISLDGVGEAHDRVRGDKGVFERVGRLIDLMRTRGFAGLRLGMTLSDGNLDQVAAVADFAGRRGLELGIVAAHACRTHLGVQSVQHGPDGKLRQDFDELIGRWLRSMRPKQWLRAHFAWNTYRALSGRRWEVRCRAGEDFFFVQADGNVYNCSVAGQSMGNLANQPWSEIWNGETAHLARTAASRCREHCWMICNARSVYRRQAVRIAGWIVWQKLRAHLGLMSMPPSGRDAGGGRQADSRKRQSKDATGANPAH